jgi:hypothetical protein
LCKSHYAKHSCGHNNLYKITFCKQQTRYFTESGFLVVCEVRGHVYNNKIVDDICDTCAYLQAFEKDPDAKPHLHVDEGACEDDATVFIAGYQLMEGAWTMALCDL